jgi:hypothetical protein
MVPARRRLLVSNPKNRFTTMLNLISITKSLNTILIVLIGAMLLLSSGAMAQAKYRSFQCKQPLPEFTLAEDSDPTPAQLETLCSCMWSSFPENGWERKTAEKLSRGENVGSGTQGFISRFGAALRNCGGYELTPSAATPDDQMILSKADADMMFRLSLDEWNQNVRMAQQAGMSRSSGEPENGLVQMLETPQGGLTVNPHYEKSKRKPDYLLVTVGYRPPHSQIFTEKGVRELLDLAIVQLGGTYVVTNQYDPQGDMAFIHWSIRPAE